MSKTTKPAHSDSAAPILHQRGKVLQEYGTVVNIPTGLKADVRLANAAQLNVILADTITLRDMYKKHHWQVAGPTFYQLHLLFDKHAGEQSELVDELAERVQTLGAIAIAMAPDVAEVATIERPPRGREEVPVQIDRLLEAHAEVLKLARALAEQTDDNKDYATNDLLTSTLIPLNETQIWFVSEHVVDVPTVRAQ